MGKYTNLHRENSAFRKTERSKSSLSSWFAFVGRSFLLADWMVVSVVGNRLFLLVSRNSFLSPLHFSSLLLDLSVSEWPAGSKLLVVTVLPPWSLPSLKKGLSPFGKESTTLVALWECNAAHRRQKEKCGLWVPSREWGLGGLAVSSRRKYYLANEFFFFFPGVVFVVGTIWLLLKAAEECGFEGLLTTEHHCCKAKYRIYFFFKYLTIN